MKLLLRLLALFLVLPVVELALLVQVDKLIGFWPTIGLIMVTGVVGSALARREGLSVWQRFNRRLAQNELPGPELVDGVIILVAGALLITPGVLTDVFGFLGLLPFTRSLIRNMVYKRAKKSMQRGSFAFTMNGGMPSRSSYHPPGSTDETTPQWGGTPRDLPNYVDNPDQAEERDESR